MIHWTILSTSLLKLEKMIVQVSSLYTSIAMYTIAEMIIYMYSVFLLLK